MPNLSIKDVPEAWADTLRQRAAQHHRSLQGELMAIIEAAVHRESPFSANAVAEPGKPRIVGFDKQGWPVVRQGWKTPEQVWAALREKYPEPVMGQPLGVDIIRADRDSR